MNFTEDGKGKGLCSYSTDGKSWTPLGGEFPITFAWQTGTFQGPQYAIFCYGSKPSDGFVDVDSFVLTLPPSGR